MFDITKLMLRIPNFLSSEECNGLIEVFENNKSRSVQEYSTHSSTLLTENSTFNALQINPSNPEVFNFVKSKTQQAVSQYVDYLDSSKMFFSGIFTGLNYSHSYRILKYKLNSSIHPHSDHSPFTYGSITLNLNEDYKGGEFCFFNNQYQVKLKQGEALIFPADYFWVHEVRPVTSGNRYSVNSFLRSIPTEGYDKTMEYFNKETIPLMNNLDYNKVEGPYFLDRMKQYQQNTNNE